MHVPIHLMTWFLCAVQDAQYNTKESPQLNTLGKLLLTGHKKSDQFYSLLFNKQPLHSRFTYAFKKLHKVYTIWPHQIRETYRLLKRKHIEIWSINIKFKFVCCDRSGESSSETDCCWWLTFRQPKRKSPSESSSLDSEHDFRSGCRNVSHQQQFVSELLSPGRSQHKTYCYSCVQTYYYIKLKLTNTQITCKTG